MLQTSDICVESGGHQLWYKHGCKMKCQNLFQISSRSENIHIDLWRPDLIGVWTCSSHTPAAFYMHPRFIVGGFCSRDVLPLLFQSGGQEEKNGKKLRENEAAGASRPQACFVFTLPDCLSVTCCLSLLPVSVPMTLLLTRAGDPSFIRPNYILWPLTAG